MYYSYLSVNGLNRKLAEFTTISLISNFKACLAYNYSVTVRDPGCYRFPQWLC